MNFSFRTLHIGILAITLASCSSPNLPHIHLAKTRLAVGKKAVVRDESLAKDLAALQATPVTNASAATEKFIVHLQRQVQLHDWKQPLLIVSKTNTWELRFDNDLISAQGRPKWSPSVFDRFIPASSFKLEGYSQIASGTGAGAPIVLAFEDVKRLRAERSFRPGNGVYSPATVVFEFGKPAHEGDDVPVRCHMINTFNQRTLKLPSSTVPLAWNVTAAVEANLGNRYIAGNGLIGLLRPDKRTTDAGLFGISDPVPTKTPVIFVHGLDSSPSIWKNAINEIYGTPELHARYTPLLFMYPSGLSVPGSAVKLRTSIQQFRDHWDPKHSSAAFDKMVLVGHSMGGLLSRLQVIDSGDDLWKAFFSRPVSEVPWMGKSEREKADAALHFKAHPCVGRVVFVAVPHRGSNIADMGIVRLAVRLIKLPKEAASFVKTALTEDVSMFNPALLRYRGMGLRSVDMLSPGHPYFEAIEKRPIKVPYHSIIGDRGKHDGAKSSDGFVPYWSSHLDGTASETFVRYGHSCTEKRETVDEIMRILRIHQAAH